MKAIRLHILMPCSRPKNIPVLAPHYIDKMTVHGFEIRWHIAIQGPDADPKGYRKINELLDSIDDGWLFAPADDTYQHHDLYCRTEGIIKDNPGIGAIVFTQCRGHGIYLQASPYRMTPCNVCGGQILWKRSFLGDHRFDYETYGGCADGELIKKLYQAYPDKFFFKDEALMYFGALEW